MSKLPFSAFAVGVVASSYVTLCMADKAAQRGDVFSFPRRVHYETSSKDYEQVLRERVHKAKYKEEREEVAMVRESYNETIKAAKGVAENAFKAADEAYKTIEDMNPFKK